MGSQFYYGITYPVFKPGHDLTDPECTVAYEEWRLDLEEWNLNFRYFSLLSAAYFLAQGVLSLVGVLLIYYANKKITSNSDFVKSETTQYVIHLTMLTLLTVSQIYTQ